MENMPKIDVITATENPIDVVSLAAGCCYGKDDVSFKRVKRCFDNGHMSVFEHASAVFKISDISRSCSHQLVRHRLASYSQRSQRYTKLTLDNLKNKDWYVIPPDILNDKTEMGRWDYDLCMEGFLVNYLGALDKGCNAEDARFLLPEAAKTEIVCTMNAREIFHFLQTRLSYRSQWEIRNVAISLVKALSNESEQWCSMMELWSIGRQLVEEGKNE